jgi:hypothetical protein
MSIETVGGTSVSSDSRGEDGYHELAGAVHSHVASPAQILSVLPRVPSSRLFLFRFNEEERDFSKDRTGRFGL